MPSYDRPYLSFEEQIIKLEKDYKLIIVNKDLALTYLRTVSYYDLINGYQEFFMKDGEFKEKIDITFLFKFYMFDKNIQTILFKYSVYVENAFKTIFSHEISNSMGVNIDEYLNYRNYIDVSYLDDRGEKLILLIKKIKSIANKTGDNPTKHYRDTHNHIPAWILFKNVFFNDVFDLFTYLKKESKLKIIDSFFKPNNLSDDDKIRLFKTTLTIVRKFRNKIAHNLKAISYKTPEKIIGKNLKKVLETGLLIKNDIKKNIGINDLYSMFLSEMLLLNNDFLKASLLNELYFLLSADSEIAKKYLEVANFPATALERILRVQTDIINRNIQFE